MQLSMGHVIAQPYWYKFGFVSSVCVLSLLLGCSITVSLLNCIDCVPFGSGNSPAGSLRDPIPTRDTRKFYKASLVILIISAPDNVMKRQDIRLSWIARIDASYARYYFVIGTKSLNEETKVDLAVEQSSFSDLLLLPNVEDTYETLTNKVLQSFVWVYDHLYFDYVLKVDDDSYVRPEQLTKELKERRSVDPLYWGYFSGDARVQHKGKWKEIDWNICDRYLPYARGGGYILSLPLIRYLALNARMLRLYKSEDVSVGSWLAALNVTRLHDVRFDTEWSSRGCSDQFLITHPHDEMGMRALHGTVTKFGRLCLQEYQKRPAYKYDWNVVPSQCCKSASSVTG